MFTFTILPLGDPNHPNTTFLKYKGNGVGPRLDPAPPYI